MELISNLKHCNLQGHLKMLKQRVFLKVPPHYFRIRIAPSSGSANFQFLTQPVRITSYTQGIFIFVLKQLALCGEASVKYESLIYYIFRFGC
ncbi:uncharacterized protein DS421_19g638340 [Arachis hypogaea]|uniref:Uncharacterized protein n=1 Tax=Arachis hypogaea TaxID=3818 RepID=A0A6B9V309_ARAHY|nr:uncharacterized protein DS421_19g638340 [Arachis hypogaea]